MDKETKQDEKEFYLFIVEDKELAEKIMDDLTGDPPKVTYVEILPAHRRKEYIKKLDELN